MISTSISCRSTFFFHDTATTEIYTLSLHDALPIFCELFREAIRQNAASLIIVHNHPSGDPTPSPEDDQTGGVRSEEHTSELQSRQYLVCRLLLEKKNKQ